MSAPLRIRQRYVHGIAAAAGSGDPAKDYVDRLIKLIPAEVVGVYLAGKGAIQAVYATKSATAQAAAGATPATPAPGEGVAWLAWSAFCLAAVFLVRGWATSDRASGTKPQWPAVFISAFSFVVWVYSLGDAFIYWHLWNPLLASLLLLAWSFLIPVLYRGDPPAPPPPIPAVVAPLGHGNATTLAARNFGSSEAEACVLGCAHSLTNRQFNLSDTVADGFDGEEQIRALLAAIQDDMKNSFGKDVELASGSSDDVADIGTKTYLELARFILEKANS